MTRQKNDDPALHDLDVLYFLCISLFFSPSIFSFCYSLCISLFFSSFHLFPIIPNVFLCFYLPSISSCSYSLIMDCFYVHTTHKVYGSVLFTHRPLFCPRTVVKMNTTESRGELFGITHAQTNFSLELPSCSPTVVFAKAPYWYTQVWWFQFGFRGRHVDERSRGRSKTKC